mmetsp:Transcript_59073/g.111364  ORF Transcript_59073/g.111364 Transcript_59073/m.111364 type:complete len:226 (+) Transcript_59073:1059-1736(+)
MRHARMLHARVCAVGWHDGHLAHKAWHARGRSIARQSSWRRRSWGCHWWSCSRRIRRCPRARRRHSWHTLWSTWNCLHHHWCYATRRASWRRDAVKQPRANVTSNATITTPVIVWHEDNLADCLMVTVINIDLHALADARTHYLHQLVNVVEHRLGGAQEVVLERYQASVCSRRIGEHLQNSYAMVFCWVNNIVANRGAKEASASPFSRIYNDLPRRVRTSVEHL